jgi:protein-S-isoprenylcysteine O-methyltransferase Ste14
VKLKIPPALQVAIFAFLIWLISKLTADKHLDFEYQKEFSWFIFAFGVFIGIIAVYAFRKAQTTVDPRNPDKASKLVIVGIYKVSRNPMYLGLFFILLAFIIKLGNLYAVPVLFVYVWYITTFQIKPEEIALKDLFGEDYSHYLKNVRRWI